MSRHLFFAFAVFLFFGCGGDDGGLPPFGGDYLGYAEYGYCRYGNNCGYMSVYECNSYGGSYYGSDGNCGSGGYYPSSSSNPSYNTEYG